MILYRLYAYEFCEGSEPTRAPNPSIATMSVNLNLRAGDGGDLTLQPVVVLSEYANNPSPCLVDVLDKSCRRETSKLTAPGNVRLTYFLSDEHPEMLLEFISGIKTPTRHISFMGRTQNLDDVIQAAEYGMWAAPHQLMTFKNLTRLASYENVKILSFPDSSSMDDVVYWTGMAVRMSDRRDIRASITTPFDRTCGLKATIAHLVNHPRLKLAWEIR